MLLKELVEEMAKSLVDFPEDVKVNVIKGERTTIYELSVASEDMGRVIGRNGRNADAMRTIISAAGAAQNERATLEIIE